jgi:hypothetical protein
LLVLLFIFETESPYGAQAGLELLDSNDSPASASQVAGITGACHHAGACIHTFNQLWIENVQKKITSLLNIHRLFSLSSFPKQNSVTAIFVAFTLH